MKESATTAPHATKWRLTGSNPGFLFVWRRGGGGGRMTPALGRVHVVTAGHLRDAESHVTDSHIGRTDSD